MRHGTTNRRSRSRNTGGRRTNNNKTKVYDSNGPDVRIRGTAHQINEKYMALAKDSRASGDFVMAESYLQHAEHYQRLINSFVEEQAEERVKQTANRTTKKVVAEDDDLSLPAGILGESVRTSDIASSDKMVKKSLVAV